MARTDKTPEEKQRAFSKFEISKSIANGGNVPAVGLRNVSKSVTVPFFSQENDYYCGPATVKQTMHAANGSSLTQATIATSLGTTSTSGTNTNNMATYLNKATDWRWYWTVLWSWKDASVLSDMLIKSVGQGQPIVAHVIIKTQGEWRYTTNGHYMNYNGYENSGKTIIVTDPYADRYNVSTGKYRISNNEAERVTDRIIW